MRSRYRFVEEEGYYFITATIVEWIPVFTTAPYFEIIKSSLDYCEQQGKFSVHAWVILDNHCHLIISGRDLSPRVKEWKSFTAKKILEQLQKEKKEWCLNQLKYFKKGYKQRSQYQVWQEGVHPQFISNEEMLWQKTEYIHLNPVRRGYVTHPEHWKYSSAYAYAEDELL